MSADPGFTVSRPPLKRRAATIADLTMLVRVPGQPSAVRAFTDDELDDANAYAADHGGTIEPLPPLQKRGNA